MTRPFSDIPPLARVMLLRLQILWIDLQLTWFGLRWLWHSRWSFEVRGFHAPNI